MALTIIRPPRTAAEKAIAAELAEVEQELSKLPLYRRREALRAALNSLTSESAGSSGTGSEGERAFLSYVQIAVAAISDAGRPLSTKEILDLAPRYGRSIGGANPATNLSNTLSAQANLVSIEWGGGKRWWISSRGAPPKEEK